MLWESFQRGLIDSQDDVAHVDAATLCSWLAREKLLHSHQAGAIGLIRGMLFSAEAEAESRSVLQQTDLKHVICQNEDVNLQWESRRGLD